MLDDKEIVRLTRRLLEPYELPDDCPYLSEDQRELCKLTPEERMEWWGEWLMMSHGDGRLKSFGSSTFRREDALTPNPIRKVLSVMRSHRVKFLLMGGQACVLYGGAEFSRDTDIAILCEEPNLRRLREALDELHAQQIAVPRLSLEYLRKGHAVHFRCRHPEAQGIRIVVMSVMRGVEGFPRLWDRRTTADPGEGEKIDLLSLPDLVAAKKTQRDKDWPIITRLVEANYASAGETPTREQVGFWLKECRSPGLLRELAGRFPEHKDVLSKERALLAMIPSATDIEIEAALQEEEFAERRKDREYWDPLRRELEHLRRQR